MTLADFVGESGAWRRNRCSRMKPSSRLTADRALDRDILPVFGDTELSEIAPADVARWFEKFGVGRPQMANRTLSVFRAICRYAVQLELLEADPTRHCVDNPKRKVTRFLSTEELRKLHECLDEYRSRGPGDDQIEIIRLLLYTGCRVGEIVNLRWAEVEDDCLRLADSKTGARTVWLSAEARAILSNRERRGSVVFPASGNPEKARSKYLCAWKSVRKSAGLQDVRIHDLRHTFASHAVMNGVALPVVSRLLGHSSLSMTMRYAHVGDAETQRMADRIGAELLQVLDAA